MNLESLSQLVGDVLQSGKYRDQTEDIIQELTVRALAGDLASDDLTSEASRRRIRRLAMSFRGRSTSLTREAEDQKALSVADEHDSNLPEDWRRLRNGFSEAELERMLERARRGETDQRNLAAAIERKPRAFRKRIQAIRNNAPK